MVTNTYDSFLCTPSKLNVVKAFFNNSFENIFVLFKTKKIQYTSLTINKQFITLNLIGIKPLTYIESLNSSLIEKVWSLN